MIEAKSSIVLAHNFYRSTVPSGENQVFEMERELLTKYGHKVSEFTRSSDDLVSQGAAGAIKGALLTPWNVTAARQVKSHLVNQKADVLHAHNTFPMLSPSLFWASRGLAARVLTLHNYRLFCPNGIPMREGKVCTDCLDKRSVAPSLYHGCYRDSRVATVPLAASVALHRAIGTWKKEIDAFICLSEFQKELMIDAGLPRHKVHVKPNFYPGKPRVRPWKERRHAVVFAGRLSAEKGVISLLKAWRAWGVDAPELRIVGDGPLRDELEKIAEGLRVTFLGQMSAQDAQLEISSCLLQILPSECYETFGLVIREAFAFGTPSAVANIGPLPFIVTNGRSGIVFDVANPASLLREVKQAWHTPGLLRDLGAGARQEFENKYTEQANYRQLIDIYDEAKEVAKHEQSKR